MNNYILFQSEKYCLFLCRKPIRRERAVLVSYGERRSLKNDNTFCLKPENISLIIVEYIISVDCQENLAAQQLLKDPKNSCKKNGVAGKL